MVQVLGGRGVAVFADIDGHHLSAGMGVGELLGAVEAAALHFVELANVADGLAVGLGGQRLVAQLLVAVAVGGVGQVAAVVELACGRCEQGPADDGARFVERGPLEGPVFVSNEVAVGVVAVVAAARAGDFGDGVGRVP